MRFGRLLWTVAYRAGRTAWAQGVNLNPHAAGTPRHDDWKAGWADARAAEMKGARS